MNTAAAGAFGTVVLLLSLLLQCGTATKKNGAVESELEQIHKDYASKLANLFGDLAQRQSWLGTDTVRWKAMDEVERLDTNFLGKAELLSNLMTETAPILISEMEQYRGLSLEVAMGREQLLLGGGEEIFAELETDLKVKAMGIETEREMRQRKRTIEPTEYGKLICANIEGILSIYKSLKELLRQSSERLRAKSKDLAEQMLKLNSEEVKSVIEEIDSSKSMNNADQWDGDGGAGKKTPIWQRIKLRFGKLKIFWAANWLIRRQLKCEELNYGWGNLEKVCKRFKEMLLRREHFTPVEMQSVLEEFYTPLLATYEKKYGKPFQPKQTIPVISFVMKPLKFALCSLKAFFHQFPKAHNTFALDPGSRVYDREKYTEQLFHMLLDKVHGAIEETKKEIARGELESNANRKARPFAATVAVATKWIGLPLVVAMLAAFGIAGIAAFVIPGLFTVPIALLLGDHIYVVWQLWIQNCF